MLLSFDISDDGDEMIMMIVVTIIIMIVINLLGLLFYRLYLPNGIKVMSLDQITPNGHFVALRKNDRFKPAHYKENSLPNLRCSPRLERKYM